MNLIIIMNLFINSLLFIYYFIKCVNLFINITFYMIDRIIYLLSK
jgi:hypothetical protein